MANENFRPRFHVPRMIGASSNLPAVLCKVGVVVVVTTLEVALVYQIK